jgi:hypothetical protein
MYTKEMESLIEAAATDGIITEQEMKVLVKRATREELDLDELEIYIQAQLYKAKTRGNTNTQADNNEKPIQKTSCKAGKIEKCPSCGAIVPGGNAACTECGYAFNENAEANKAAIKLQQDLMAIDAEYRIALQNTKEDKDDDAIYRRNDLRIKCAETKNTRIMNTVVPNTRADLLELLAFTKTKANRDGSRKGWKNVRVLFMDGWEMDCEDFGYAYWCVFEACISMAMAHFKDDPAFQIFFKTYKGT